MSVVFHPHGNHTVFDSFVRASDEFHPVVVADPHNPKQFTVTAKQDAPTMHVDFIEHPASFAFHADMPGFKKDDIHVVVSEGVLIVEATRHHPEMDTKPDAIHHSERRLGKVLRSFRLPANASVIPQPKVTYIDGVLTVMFEKTGVSTRGERIPIP